MNMPHDDDMLSPQERALAQRLAQLDGRAAPSAALDARILAAARGTAAQPSVHATAAPPAMPRRRRKPRWPSSLGIAASLALAVGVAWQLRPQPETHVEYTAVERAVVEQAAVESTAPASGQPTTEAASVTHEGSDAARTAEAMPAPAPAMAPPVEQTSQVATEPTPSPARQDAPKPQEAPAPRARRTPIPIADTGAHTDTRSEVAPMVVAPAPAAAMAPPPAPPAPPATTAAPMEADEPGFTPTPPQRDAAHQATAASVERREAETARARNAQSAMRRDNARKQQAPPAAPAPPSPRVAPAVTAAAAPVFDSISTTSKHQSRVEVDALHDQPMDDQPPATVDSPAVRKAWLQRVRVLRDTGQLDAARASLQEFHRRYPDTPLPDDLKPLLDE